MKNRNGFTLVELLITIAIVSIIFSISIITVNNVIENSKGNSNTIAINNIKNSANLYIKEYPEELNWEVEEGENNLEKVCISIERLIAKGYFEKNIIENNNVPKSIILTKDKNNTIISKEAQNIDCNSYKEKVPNPKKDNVCYSITYDGEQHHLINESNQNPNYLEMKYVNETYNNEDNRPKNAGNYEVKISLKEGKKWTDNTNQPKTVTCTINKAKPTLSLNPPGHSTLTIETSDITLTSNVTGTLEIKTSNRDHAIAEVDNNIMEANPSNPNKITKTIKIRTIASRDAITYITINLKSNNPNYKNGSIEYTVGKVETKKINKPTCNNLTYNGNAQKLVQKNEAYRLDNNTATNYDTYTVKATLNYGYIWSDNTNVPVSIDCTIKRPTPTVTYKNATCNPTTKVVTYKDTYGTLCNPTKPGYTFKGWYTDESLTNAVTSSTTVNNFNNHNLYAKWQIHKIYIKYNTNGGKVQGTNKAYTQTGDDVLLNGNVIVQTYNYGDTGINLNNYNNKNHLYIVKTGYGAKSNNQWNTKTNGTGTSYNQATDYKASDICNANTSNCTLQLYVNWVDNVAPTCSITYRNGGSSWVTSGVDITVNCSDSGSGCKKSSIDYNNVTSDETYTVKDNVGNSGTCKLDIKSRTRWKKRTRSWIEQCTSTCKGDYVCSGAGTASCNSSAGLVSINGKCCYWDSCKSRTWSGCYSDWSSWSGYIHDSCTETTKVDCSSRKEYKKNS